MIERLFIVGMLRTKILRKSVLEINGNIDSRDKFVFCFARMNRLSLDMDFPALCSEGLDIDSPIVPAIDGIAILGFDDFPRDMLSIDTDFLIGRKDDFKRTMRNLILKNVCQAVPDNSNTGFIISS